MKRSEMILALQDAVMCYVSESISKNEASNILKDLEDCGMLPPTIEKESFLMLDNGEMTYQVNRWEPEDETK